MSSPKKKPTKDERHMAENQVAFRQMNSKVSEGFNRLIAIAKEDNQKSLIELPTGTLLFSCECADQYCVVRIKLTLSAWIEVHKNPKDFCICQGHIIEKIEALTEHNIEYDVVRKYNKPRQNNTHFWATSAHFV